MWSKKPKSCQRSLWTTPSIKKCLYLFWFDHFDARTEIREMFFCFFGILKAPKVPCESSLPLATVNVLQTWPSDIVLWSKGQLISKCLFGVFNSPKKRKKTIRLEVPYVVVKSNFFVHFLGELKILKRHFEINWPLETWDFAFELRFEHCSSVDIRVTWVFELEGAELIECKFFLTYSGSDSVLLIWL